MNAAPMCAFCIWFNRNDRDEPDSCRAFPGGIPSGILEGRIDHRVPVEGDHGLQFNQDPAQPIVNLDERLGGSTEVH